MALSPRRADPSLAMLGQSQSAAFSVPPGRKGGEAAAREPSRGARPRRVPRPPGSIVPGRAGREGFLAGAEARDLLEDVADLQRSADDRRAPELEAELDAALAGESVCPHEGEE